jgi:DNA-directed RNA polymerase specialized sigma24 family protein
VTGRPGGLRCRTQVMATRHSQFAPTRWTLVLDASKPGDTEQAQRALAELCRLYWQPLYAYVRRCGHDPHTAEDLTQEFFARLLAKDALAGVAPGKGKFRSFLLMALKRFLANEWDKARAQKRGGGAVAAILILAIGRERMGAVEDGGVLVVAGRENNSRKF